MKFKRHLKYRLFKIIFKNYTKFIQILYKHKLNSNLINLIKKEVEIKTIYDIGAHRGDFSNFLSKTSLKGKEFYLFEANEKNEKYLRKFSFKYFIEVLSDKKKEVQFYSKPNESLGGDSYFRETTDIYDSFDSSTKITETLDNLVKKNKLPLPNLIKIDTQGSEIDILKGASKSIANCKLIYLECPIIEYNLGSPNLDQYIKYLGSINFIPYDICEVHYIDKILVQIDILFIKMSTFNKVHPEKKNLNILN